jgi:hypothetical protein
VFSNTIAESIRLESVRPSFDRKVRRLVSHGKQIAFLDKHVRYGVYKLMSRKLKEMIRAYSTTDTAIALCSLGDWCKVDGEFDRAAMAVATIALFANTRL